MYITTRNIAGGTFMTAKIAGTLAHNKSVALGAGGRITPELEAVEALSGRWVSAQWSMPSKSN